MHEQLINNTRELVEDLEREREARELGKDHSTGLRTMLASLDVDRPNHGMTGVGSGPSAAQLTDRERERRRRARKATRRARKAHR